MYGWKYLGNLLIFRTTRINQRRELNLPPNPTFRDLCVVFQVRHGEQEDFPAALRGHGFGHGFEVQPATPVELLAFVVGVGVVPEAGDFGGFVDTVVAGVEFNVMEILSSVQHLGM